MATPARAQKSRRLRLFDSSTNDFKMGAAVLQTAGVVAEAGATPTDLLGFSAEDSIPSGVNLDVHPNKALIAIGAAGSTFALEMRNAGTQVAPVVGDIGTSYGIAKDTSNGAWYVERSNTTQLAVRVVNILEKPANAPDGFALVEVELVAPQIGG